MSGAAEFRGSRIWVWTTDAGASFEPAELAACVEVRAPIGWTLRSDPARGVVLAGVHADSPRLDAAQVESWADEERMGFRVVSRKPRRPGRSPFMRTIL